MIEQTVDENAHQNQPSEDVPDSLHVTEACMPDEQQSSQLVSTCKSKESSPEEEPKMLFNLRKTAKAEKKSRSPSHRHLKVAMTRAVGLGLLWGQLYVT